MYKLDYVTMAGATVATDTETFATKEAALRKGLAQIADVYAFNLYIYIKKGKAKHSEGHFLSWKKLNKQLIDNNYDIDQVVAIVLSE